ncbi:MAG TPA: hypothetical protein VE868_03890 [Balneolaceae bacterium]|nr:hypothetical protein [Balneolaceae bacterium]
MIEGKNYAVITGDLVNFSEINTEEKDHLIQALKRTFDGISAYAERENALPSFNIYRGDSFQGVLADPSEALWAGLFIRSSLRKNHTAQQKTDWDARISIGIGTIDYLPETVSEGDGPAYRNSGPGLDELKSSRKFTIKTPWAPINEEFETSCMLLDAVLNKWTSPQAEIVYMLLQKMTPKEIGKELGISQAAIYYRVKGAGWHAIESLLDRYKNVIENELHQ